MATLPTRFTVSDKETNLPTIDFRTIKTSEVLNKALENGLKLSEEIKAIASLVQGDALKNMLKEFADDALGAVVSTVTDYAGQAVSGVLSTVDGYVSRTAETVLGSVSNLASQGMAVIDKVAGPALEGMEQIKSTIRQLDPQGYINIVSDALQTSIGPTISNLAGAVDTVTGTLSTSKAYGDLVNTLTDGKYSALFSNDSVSEKITTVITKHTADLGLSGVFSSFVEKYGSTAGVVSAGSELLKHASGTGNTALLYEVATSAVGPAITAQVPNATALIASGTKLKAGTDESSFSQLFDKMQGALAAVDSGWDRIQSSAGALLSIQKITPASADFKTVLTAAVHQTTPVVSTTAVVPPLPSTSYIHAALSTPVIPVKTYFQKKYMVSLLQQTDLSPF